jgi:hypothetical protein
MEDQLTSFCENIYEYSSNGSSTLSTTTTNCYNSTENSEYTYIWFKIFTLDFLFFAVCFILGLYIIKKIFKI